MERLGVVAVGCKVLGETRHRAVLDLKRLNLLIGQLLELAV